MKAILTKKENSNRVIYAYDGNHKLNHIRVVPADGKSFSLYIENENVVYNSDYTIVKFNKYKEITEYIEKDIEYETTTDSNGDIIGRKIMTILRHPRKINWDIVAYARDMISMYGKQLKVQNFFKQGEINYEKRL